MRTRLTFLGAPAVLLVSTIVLAQQPPVAGQSGRGAGQQATVRSPEIMPDGTVTFRLAAPIASSVVVRNTTGGYADWPDGNEAAMKKDEQGVWSVTIGPLKPEFYTYAFVVDGVQALDPRNVTISRDGTRYSSALRLAGEKTANYQVNDVPHGTVSLAWYPSPSLNLTRRMYVYTPPGYEASGTTRYPVFYLLHGGGGDEDAWTTLGRAPEILDNLIAQGKAKPMIVVMTNGNASQRASQDFVSATAPAAPGPGARILDFPRSLVADVIPFVDRTYRTRPDRENRAIAGLSMGGAQTLYAAFNNLDTFAWVGALSGGFPLLPEVAVPIPAPENAGRLRGPDVTRSIDPEKFLALHPQLNASANSQLRLFYLAIGTEDGLISTHATLKQILKSKGVNATIVETPGYAHEWAFWRVALSDLAPRLFQTGTR